MLLPLSLLYGALLKTRARLYRKGLLRSDSPGAVTVSIGNITVGGTGKTPLVAFAAGVLAECGAKVCILTRGYGRRNPKRRVVVSDGKTILADPRISGDEPVELARKLFGKALVVADPNRVSAGKWARHQFGVTAFVLDDGFQHLQAKRDLDIVAIDATDAFGNGRLLPAGILREPLENLARADVIVITRANLSGRIDELRSRITEFNPKAQVFVSENKTSGLVELEDFHTMRQTSVDRGLRPEINALAFCALGNPDIFFEQLRRDSFPLVAVRKFTDHHYYSQADADDLSHRAAAANAGILLTTAKDAVKLKSLTFELPCFVVETSLIFDDEKKLRRIIGAVFDQTI